MGIALYFVWIQGLKKKEDKTAIIVFAVQLALNLLWSIIFFGLHQPFYAFIEIVILWLSILITILKFYKISKPSAYILIPYILWVSFAALLNLFLVLLN
jgi:benzodiazapine receptor